MARRYRRSDEPLDDLVQVATLGLIKAIDRFDPARETAFSSYAVPTMLGELKRYFRDNGWAVHVPRGMQERVMQVDNCVKDLSRKIGRSPSVHEIGTALDLTTEQVLEAMEAASAYDAVSLESYRFGDEDWVRFYHRGELAQAREHLASALGGHWSLGDPRGVAFMSTSLAALEECGWEMSTAPVRS